MKVLHIISSAGMYGAEAVILNLARGMRGQTDGVSCDGPHAFALAVFSNSANPNPQLHKAATAENFESHVVPCKGQVDSKAVKAISMLVQQTGSDLVHAHGYKADVYTWLALRGRGVPLISTCHNWLDTGRIVAAYGILDRFLLRRYTRVVAVSDDVKLRLLRSGVPEHRIAIVRNGIDLRPFANPLPSPVQPQRDLVLGLVARLSPEKGVDLFLSAAAIVVAEFPRARFVIIGDGPDNAALERQIDALGLRDRTTMAGRRDDMPAAYASLDIMVSSSRLEGLPMAILEGMASGLPLVATAVGDVPTVVRDGITGLLVPPNDVPALAAAMLSLLRDASLRARLGTAARQLVTDEYSAERMVADYLRVYQAALAEEQRR